jgi:hypothetical protein
VLAVIGSATPPSAEISLADISSASCFRLEITTLAPAVANTFAIANPMPLDAPVIKATLLVRSNDGVLK